MLILFVIDTSASMNKKTTSGVTHFDIAKSAIEHFLKMRCRDPNSRNDRYVLLTFSESAQDSIKVSWKDSVAYLMTVLKNLEACDLSQLATTLKRSFDVGAQYRLQPSVDNFGQRRYPFFQESVFIVVLTDNEANTSLTDGVSDTIALGSNVSPDPFRWTDQSIFGLILDFPTKTGIKTSKELKKSSKETEIHPNNNTSFSSKKHESLSSICERSSNGQCKAVKELRHLFVYVDEILMKLSQSNQNSVPIFEIVQQNIQKMMSTPPPNIISQPGSGRGLLGSKEGAGVINIFPSTSNILTMDGFQRPLFQANYAEPMIQKETPNMKTIFELTREELINEMIKQRKFFFGSQQQIQSVNKVIDIDSLPSLSTSSFNFWELEDPIQSEKEEIQKHTVPISEMGNFAQYVMKKQVLRNPHSEEDTSQSEWQRKKPNFGSPFAPQRSRRYGPTSTLRKSFSRNRQQETPQSGATSAINRVEVDEADLGTTIVSEESNNNNISIIPAETLAQNNVVSETNKQESKLLLKRTQPPGLEEPAKKKQKTESTGEGIEVALAPQTPAPNEPMQIEKEKEKDLNSSIPNPNNVPDQTSSSSSSSTNIKDEEISKSLISMSKIPLLHLFPKNSIISVFNEFYERDSKLKNFFV